MTFRLSSYGHHRLSLVMSVSLALFALCCDLFSPRGAEAPTQAGFQYLPRTFPSYVLQNLRDAIAQKDVVEYTD